VFAHQCDIRCAPDANQAVSESDVVITATPGGGPLFDETPCVEMGAVLLGEAAFSRAAGDLTVFDMTGLALQDLTVARLIYERALAQGLGSRIGWPW